MKTWLQSPFSTSPRAPRLALSMAVLCATFALSAQAADVDKGKEKADQICAACHGKDGNTPIDPSYPKLAGQHRDYLEHALLDYQAERRKNPIMVAQAKPLSREEIENLAAYYASLPGQLSTGR